MSRPAALRNASPPTPASRKREPRIARERCDTFARRDVKRGAPDQHREIGERHGTTRRIGKLRADRRRAGAARSGDRRSRAIAGTRATQPSPPQDGTSANDRVPARRRRPPRHRRRHDDVVRARPASRRVRRLRTSTIASRAVRPEPERAAQLPGHVAAGVDRQHRHAELRLPVAAPAACAPAASSRPLRARARRCEVELDLQSPVADDRAIDDRQRERPSGRGSTRRRRRCGGRAA